MHRTPAQMERQSMNLIKNQYIPPIGELFFYFIFHANRLLQASFYFSHASFCNQTTAFNQAINLHVYLFFSNLQNTFFNALHLANFE